MTISSRMPTIDRARGAAHMAGCIAPRSALPPPEGTVARSAWSCVTVAVRFHVAPRHRRGATWPKDRREVVFMYQSGVVVAHRRRRVGTQLDVLAKRADS
jgi:hypothetical protein